MSATIVVPTGGRPDYLDVTLATVAPQAAAAGAEIVVVSDGPAGPTREVAEQHGARLVELPDGPGLNAARNAGVAAAQGELVIFVDDDVAAPAGWLEGFLAGARRHPDAEVLAGPIRAVLEGGGPRACGREPPPITTLDLGPEDREARFAWGANMAVRASAFARIGPFDEAIGGSGDEEDWQRRLRAAGGTIMYVAAAGLDHRRTAEDSRLRSLARAAWHRGRAARRYDARRGAAPGLPHELRVFIGCLYHAARRRCAIGLVLAAHSAGRLRETHLRSHHQTRAGTGVHASGGGSSGAPFVSGASGTVLGVRRVSQAVARDAVEEARRVASGERLRLARAAARAPRRCVLVLAIEREDVPGLLPAALQELERSRHDVHVETTPAGDRGKWENLNLLLERHPAPGHDWLILLDDDVALPRGFLDRFLLLAERFDLRLAQPAHRARSHAAWDVTRRHANSAVRETLFVEIGPVVALHHSTYETLLPFPPLRVGWGLDAHWAAVARDHGWRAGIVDAVAVRHGLRPVASAYAGADAVAESQAFLEGRPHITPGDARRTLVTHRTW